MSKEIKVGIVCYPTFGGSGVVATELGKALAKKGHKVHFITHSQPIRLDFLNENLFYHEVNIQVYPLFEYPPYEVALASKMVSVVKNEGLNLLHVHYAVPHASAAYLAKKILLSQGISIPVITTLHGTDITLVGRDVSYEPVVTFSINQSDGITAVSNDLRERTFEFFNVDKPIKVIPNFIDVQKFKKRKKDHFKKAICPHEEPLIVHVSNFRKVKRIKDVIRIFDNICKVVPSKMLMVGDGPERSGAEVLCRDLGICDAIRFLGKVEAIEEVLSVTDLFLMPSEQESFGLAALEAMACGTPVVSSNAGGIPELNLHGVTGLVSPIGDIADMSKNALFILDKNNADRFKENARKHAEKFDVSNIVPIYERYYQEVIKNQLAFK